MQFGRYELQFGQRTLLMGVLNVTPDSFSDGGKHHRFEDAVDAAWEMAKQGADILDIGGESTRPGHIPITVQAEIDRILPIIERLQQQDYPLPISVDTYKSSVAKAALAAGASMINDIWGLQKDENMASVAAEWDVPVIVMHNQEQPIYPDGVMEGIRRFFAESFQIAKKSGLSEENLILDPGFGFGKTADHNLEMTRHMHELKALGRPILYGPSRKSTIGRVLQLPVEEREEGTAALVSLAIAQGADIVRVHDVQAMHRVARMCDAVIRGWRPSSWQG